MAESINFRGIKDFEKRLEEAETKTLRAASSALNKGADYLRKRGVEEVVKQVSLTRPYARKNLTVTERAQPKHGRLSSTVTGRKRPTSLLRFDGVDLGRGKGVSVNVAGRRRVIRRGFPMKLKGRGGQGENVGLAIRLPKNDRIKNKRIVRKPLFKDKDTGIWLLYGPSVDQIFRNATRPMQGFPDKVMPDTYEVIQKEFERAFRANF